MSNPSLLLLDLVQVSQIIHRTASAVALDTSTSMAWKKDTSTAGKVIDWAGWTARVVVFPVGIYNKVTTGTVYEGPGSVEVDTNKRQFETLTQQLAAAYTRSFVRAATEGPAQTTAFFNEMNQKRVNATRGLQSTFREAKAINDDIVRAWDIALRRTDTVEVVCAAGITVGLSFVAAPVWALTLAGVGYGVTIDLVKTASGAPAASAVGYVEKHGMNTVTSGATNQAQSTIGRKLLESSKQATDLAGQKYADKVARYSGGRGQLRNLPHGGTAKLTGKQFKLVNKAGQKLTQAQQRHAAKSIRVDRGMGAAAAAVGLFFMREDLVRAFNNIKAEFE